MAVDTDAERYRDLRPLGAGGMGTVTLAEDRLLGRQVALKRLRNDPSVTALSRLKREALVGASVNHPNLVSIFDVLTEPDGGVVVVMEYVPGQTLAAALSGTDGLPPQEALRILRGVAAGLDAIHARGIVHRDVKPANVLLGEDGAVKVADLGVAAVPDGTQITSAGTVLGSWRYMAPEQLEGERSTPALDIYALAAVAYEALSGRAARREENPMALAHAIATQPPPDIRNDWAGAPPKVAEVLSAGMARETGARPASAGQLVDDLAAALAPAPEPAPTPAPAAPTRVAPAARRERPAAVPVPVPTRAAAERGAPVRFSGPPERGRRGLWLALLLGIAAIAVAAIVLASGSGSTNSASKRTATASPAHHHTTKTTTHATSSQATSTAASVSQAASSTPATSSAAAPGPGAAKPGKGPKDGAGPASGGAIAGGAGAPASTVQRFYSMAAAHDYAGAWALADPAAQSQLGGYSSFQAGQSGDRSITFRSLSTQAQHGDTATVALQTTSVRTDGTHQCGGTADLVRSQGTWLLHQIHINCG